MLLDLLHEHFEEVGCAHAGPLPNLPVQRSSKLTGLTIEREYQLELPSLLAGEHALRRQLVVVRYPYLLGSAPTRLRRLAWHLVHVVEATLTVSSRPSEAIIFRQALHLDFSSVLNSLFPTLSVEHLVERTPFDREAAIELVLLP